jgi:hypothetical protein
MALPPGQIPPQAIQRVGVVLPRLVEPPAAGRANVAVRRCPRRAVGIRSVVGELPEPVLVERVTVGLVCQVEEKTYRRPALGRIFPAACMEEDVSQQRPVRGAVCLELAQAGSPHIFQYYFARHLRVVVVEVFPEIGGAGNRVPEGARDDAAFRGGGIERQTRVGQRRQGQPHGRDGRAVIEAVTAECALYVVELRVVDRRAQAGEGPSPDSTDDRLHLAVLRPVTQMSPDGEDRLARTVEAREITPRPRQVPAPELIEKEYVEAPVARMHGLNDDVRRQCGQNLIGGDTAEPEMIPPAARRIHLFCPLCTDGFHSVGRLSLAARELARPYPCLNARKAASKSRSRPAPRTITNACCPLTTRPGTTPPTHGPPPKPQLAIACLRSVTRRWTPPITTAKRFPWPSPSPGRSPTTALGGSSMNAAGSRSTDELTVTDIDQRATQVPDADTPDSTRQ